MYTGKLLHALVNAYKDHLMEGQPGYFDNLSDYYLRHDFPPDFTKQNPPPTPSQLIQSARENENYTIVNKLIDALLDEYRIDASLQLPATAEDRALNIYFYPKKELDDLLYYLRKIDYSIYKHENDPKLSESITTKATSIEQFENQIMPNQNRISSVVAEGKNLLLKDSPYETNVFVMMKFSEEPIINHNDQLLEEIWKTISYTLGHCYGLNALRADKKDYSKGNSIWNNVCIYMEASKYGIAVLENLTSLDFNPNIAIEYGYMQGIGCNVLLLKEKSFKNIRADLLGRIWKEFSASDISTIRETVHAAIHKWAVDNKFVRLAD